MSNLDKTKKERKDKHKHKKLKQDNDHDQIKCKEGSAGVMVGPQIIYKSINKHQKNSHGGIDKTGDWKDHRHTTPIEESNPSVSVSSNAIKIILPEKKTVQSYNDTAKNAEDLTLIVSGGRVVSSSAQEFQPIVVSSIPSSSSSSSQPRDVSLLLFYQYIEPLWNEEQFQAVLQFVQGKGREYSITGRMRVAYEGLNCTLTGTFQNIRLWCRALQEYQHGKYFSQTEFKLTDELPRGQAFPKLHAFKVDELVHYGLDGKQHVIPSIHMSGVHLEPQEYHTKMSEADTVIIDVRNHYEAAIGRFDPPTQGATYVDPQMRKSTEFPSWLDKSSTKELLRGKQVLMYCTGGVRCERASALLRMKMETEDDVKELGIKGVYQLQGGIDKYFKDFPEGGYWKGKNYVFDKRFAHAPPLIEGLERAQKIKETLMESVATTVVAAASSSSSIVNDGNDTKKSEMKSVSTLPEKKKRKKNKEIKATQTSTSTMSQTPDSVVEPIVILTSQGGNLDEIHVTPTIMGKCESCQKPWDKYRGKRRCPTCGVPSLICKECYDADAEGKRLLGPSIRCDLCVAENITSKKQLARKMDQDQEQYERKLKKSKIAGMSGVVSVSMKDDSRRHDLPKNDSYSSKINNAATTQTKSTRLLLKNMCVKRMDQETLVQHIPNITHIQWITDRKTGEWYGSAFVELKSVEDAEYAVNEVNGQALLGRPIRISYAPPDPKDKWPLPNTCII